MSAWWPKGSPHEKRPLDQFADWEVRALIAYAGKRIAAEVGDTAEARRLTAWRDRFQGEMDERVQVRADITPLITERLAQRSVSGGSGPTGKFPLQNAPSGGSK